MAVDFVPHNAQPSQIDFVPNGPQKQPFSGVHFSDAKIDDGMLHGSRRGSSPESSDAHRIHIGNGAPAAVHVYRRGSVAHPSIARRKHAYAVDGNHSIAQIESEPIWRDTLKAAYKEALAGGMDKQTAYHSAINEAERALQSAGYTGYTSMKHPSQVVLFGDQPITLNAPNVANAPVKS